MTDLELKELLLSRYNEDNDKIIGADYRNDNRWTVYIHIVPKSISEYDYDKYYVGITSKKTSARWGHGWGYKDKFFGNAIQKYGWDNIEHHIIIEHITKNEAKKIEQSIIKALSSNDKIHGYNLTAGGDTVYFPEGRFTKVVLLNTRKTYKSIKEAAADPNNIVSETSITVNCYNRSRYGGHDINGKFLVWRRLDDYVKMSEEEINYLVDLAQLHDHPLLKDPYVCLNTGDIFKTAYEAGLFIGSKNVDLITQCVNGKRISFGTMKNGIRVVWCRLSEYKNMSQDDIKQRIINGQKNCFAVVDVNTKILYRTKEECANAFNISNTVILDVVRDTYTQNSIYYHRFKSFQNYLKDSSLSYQQTLSELKCA